MSRVRRIHDLPAIDRPREKLQRKGAAALSDFELLEVIIGKGSGQTTVGTIALQLQRLIQQGLDGMTMESLLRIKGIHLATASTILAALELAKRQLAWEAEPLRSINDILPRLSDIRTKQQEYVICLSLDGASRLIARRTVAVGTLDAVIAHPREVFADAIADRAASIVVAHNHPSGDTRPSQKDITLTQQLNAAGQLLGIPLRDHIIVTKTDYFSFSQHHFIY